MTPPDFRRAAPLVSSVPGRRKVAFVAHFIQAEHLPLWDRSLAPWTLTERETFLRRLYRHMDPFWLEPRVVRSVTGEEVELHVVGLCLDSATIYRHLRGGDLGVLQERVAEAVAMAARRGCLVVGLGGYSSIVTRNGTTLGDPGIGITTGNSLTVGMGLEAMFKAARDCGIELGTACAAVVGAGGNIGSVYGEMIARRVGRLVLIGRNAKLEAAHAVAATVYRDAALELLQHGVGEGCGNGASPIAAALQGTRSWAHHAATFRPDDPAAAAGLYAALREELGDDGPVTVTAELTALRRADLILTASNSAEPIVFPEMLKDGRIVVNDISVPADLHPSVARERPAALLLQGGLVRLPCESQIRIPGIPLEPGVLFACLSETLLLGLEGRHENFSYGRISPGQVDTALALAARHGFTLARFKTERSY